MPELPDIAIYISSLERHVRGKELERVRVVSPFFVRTYDPPIESLEGRELRGLRRLGKRLVWDFGDELFLVLHLMIAGRMRWTRRGVAVPRKGGLAAFDFAEGALLFTEASSRKRASLHLVRGEEVVRTFDRGGLEVLEASLDEFRGAILRENRTLKRALTDPRLLSGIGNAYSDEILHDALLSPLKRTRDLNEDEVGRLHEATVRVLRDWTEVLREEVGDGFPDKVTAFRPGMAVHGRFRKPCPRCQAPVQRIRYATNECNYCPVCQTNGKLLADRSLSRLLKGDWPRTLEELEDLHGGARGGQVS